MTTKNIIHIIITAIVLLLPSAVKADRTRHEVARADNPSMQWVESGVISLRFTCPVGIEMGGEKMIRISPVVKRAGRKDILFPQVIYLSRAGKRYFDRRMQYNPDAGMMNSHILLPHRNAGADEFVYSDTLAVGSMAGGMIEINYYYTDCCSEYLLLTDTVDVCPSPFDTQRILPLPLLVNRVPVDPNSVVFRAPEGEAVKTRSQTVRIPLNYRWNKSNVDKDYMDNSLHLSMLDSILRPVADNRDSYTFSRIDITGYASPEGEYDYNARLSERRAGAFARYVSSHYGIGAKEMKWSGAGEDWLGLKREVEADSMVPRRADVLRIIDSYGIRQGREKKLMDLYYGRPYMYMQREFFPKLRRIEMLMEYTVAHFSAEKAVEMIASRPQDLDTYELYEAARRLNPDSMIYSPQRCDYGMEYDLAAQLYPDDVNTLINAASAALLRYDLARAYTYLRKLYDEPLAWNNIGVYYWMCGDTARAREFFLRATAVTPEAEINLRQMETFNSKYGTGKAE